MTAPPRFPPRRARALPRPRSSTSSAVLARPLVAAALAASSAGCLVVSPPEYDEPRRTAPVLTADFPPTHLPVHIQDQHEEFGALVLSEDNGEPVSVALYVDYGVRSPGDLPYLRLQPPMPVGTGTIAGGQRAFPIVWNLSQTPLSDNAMGPKQCHTLTMVASHDFDECRHYCPTDPADVGSLTWQIINCDPDEPDCPRWCPAVNCEVSECLYCEDVEDTCDKDR